MAKEGSKTKAFGGISAAMGKRQTCNDDQETARLSSLLNLGILDTPPEREFDEITRLAALACGTQGAAVTMVDTDRVWVKSSVHTNVSEVSRIDGLCSIEIGQGELLVIADTWQDARSASSSLIEGDDAVRFYAGAPLRLSTGHCIGRLCVFDHQPRPAMATEHREALLTLATMIVELIEMRRFRRIGMIASQVVDVTSDAILCANAHGVITYWNAAAETMFGYAASEATGSSLALIMPPEAVALHTARFARAVAGGPLKPAGQPIELIGLKADGCRFAVEVSLGRWQDGSVPAIAAIIRDITGRKSLEREREQTRRFLDTVIENLPAMLFVKDAYSQRYLLMNKAGAKIAGREQADFIGRTDSELFPGLGAGYEARDRAACASAGVHEFESEHVRDDGQRLNLRTKRLVIDAPHENTRYLLGITQDVTEARRAQAEVQRLAEYDSLTGLRNRAGFVSRLEKLIAAGTPFTLLSIDLDRFKAINDQFGHIAGDEVLTQIGARLSTVASNGDIVARVGGDEFVMIAKGQAAARRAYDLAPAIIAAVEVPIATARIRAFVGASIGVASYPGDGTTSTELRQAADRALYKAKQTGRGTTCFYDEAMDAAVRDSWQLEQSLRAALEHDDIDVAFQPVFSMKTDSIVSFEALARWTHPTRGIVSPAEFIALAEECGLIEILGARILRMACLEAAGWPGDIQVAVNLSPIQFQTGRLYESVRAALDATGLSPRRLQLEVTEGLLIHDVDRTFEQLEQLRELGIQILMDDFGVGYSSLSYFQRFPFDKVKIDRSFVDAAPTSSAAEAIVRAVVQLGGTLGMSIIGEGVENDDQLRLLKAVGCTESQGYLLGRPVPRAEMSMYLRSAI
jgi:diguanylate cyclase (GGDEF)-like protein/PAS domain S-box-containing protein